MSRFWERDFKATHDVFGVSPDVLPDSYVDRGDLDHVLALHLGRKIHIALRGPSKCGKSWLRRRVMPNALVVQCRLGMTPVDIYRAALSELGIRLVTSSDNSRDLAGKVEAQAGVGGGLLARLGIKSSIATTKGETDTLAPVGHDLYDLRFVADQISASGRRLVVEDFHYLSSDAKREFAYDLKSLWDYGLFVVVVGIWDQRNLFVHMQHDLAARVHEMSLEWTEADLARIFHRGGGALRIDFSAAIQTRAIRECYANAGILQRLILGTLDEAGIYRAFIQPEPFEREDKYVLACMNYVDELDTIYARFADRVATGIRSKDDPVGIFPQTMAVLCLQATDEELVNGLEIASFAQKAQAQESNLEGANFHRALCEIENLQVDQDGRGLVFSYNQHDRTITVVDRQFLLYRKYRGGQWPWQGLIREARPESNASEF